MMSDADIDMIVICYLPKKKGKRKKKKDRDDTITSSASLPIPVTIVISWMDQLDSSHLIPSMADLAATLSAQITKFFRGARRINFRFVC